MANKKDLVMAWSKCKIAIAKTPEGDTMATELTDIGIIHNNTTELSASEGDALQAIESGGAIVAEEKLEGTFEISTEVIEPSDELYTMLGIGTKNSGSDTSDEELKVSTHVVPGYFSMKLTPKNLGAKGIKAPKCSVSVAPAFGDDTGHALTLTFSVLQGDAGYWYSKYVNHGDNISTKQRLRSTGAIRQ